MNPVALSAALLLVTGTLAAVTAVHFRRSESGVALAFAVVALMALAGLLGIIVGVLGGTMGVAVLIGWCAVSILAGAMWAVLHRGLR